MPEIYLKHLEDTEGLYEIRVQLGNDEIRIFPREQNFEQVITPLSPLVLLLSDPPSYFLLLTSIFDIRYSLFQKAP